MNFRVDITANLALITHGHIGSKLPRIHTEAWSCWKSDFTSHPMRVIHVSRWTKISSHVTVALCTLPRVSLLSGMVSLASCVRQMHTILTLYIIPRVGWYGRGACSYWPANRYPYCCRHEFRSALLTWLSLHSEDRNVSGEGDLFVKTLPRRSQYEHELIKL
jgi:hypothetical protein